MKKEAKHPVRASAKTLEIVEYLKENGGARIYELDDQFELSQSAIHNHIATLREYGYVVKIDKVYHLSLKFLDIGGHLQNRDSLFRAAKPVLVELGRDLEGRIDLLVEENGEGVYLDREVSIQSENITPHVGMRISLVTDPAGRTILAYLDAERVETILDRDPNPVPDDFESSLKEIRDAGYTEGTTADDSERKCVAAPIISEEDNIVGSLGISATTEGYNDALTDDSVAIVKKNADVIGRNLKSMNLRESWIKSSPVRDY
jgi:DNA-binding IclR family transcriptional regulator